VAVEVDMVWHDHMAKEGYFGMEARNSLQCGQHFLPQRGERHLVPFYAPEEGTPLL
jgi:hypothetical protein